jgi:hypothetical protein
MEKAPYWKRRSDALRCEVFSRYCGGTPRCMCPGCGVTFIEFLQMDHVAGDGAAHRKANKIGTGGARLWQLLKDQGYPPGFQVLCRNCNGAKFTRPACPLARQPHCGCSNPGSVEFAEQSHVEPLQFAGQSRGDGQNSRRAVFGVLETGKEKT